MFHISSLNTFLNTVFQTISIMSTKREKAHYECKQLSCGDVMLSEQQQNHTTKAAKAKPAERTWVWDSHSNTVDSEAAAWARDFIGHRYRIAI